MAAGRDLGQTQGMQADDRDEKEEEEVKWTGTKAVDGGPTSSSGAHSSASLTSSANSNSIPIPMAIISTSNSSPNSNFNSNSNSNSESKSGQATTRSRPLILITEPPNSSGGSRTRTTYSNSSGRMSRHNQLASYSFAGDGPVEVEGGAENENETGAETGDDHEDDGDDHYDGDEGRRDGSGDVANGTSSSSSVAASAAKTSADHPDEPRGANGNNNRKSETNVDVNKLSSKSSSSSDKKSSKNQVQQEDEELFEEIDGIQYRIVAAVTKPARPRAPSRNRSRPADASLGLANVAMSPDDIHQEEEEEDNNNDDDEQKQNSRRLINLEASAQLRRSASTSAGRRQRAADRRRQSAAANNSNVTTTNHLSSAAAAASGPSSRLNSVRRKSSAFVSNLLHSTFGGPSNSRSSHELGGPDDNNNTLDVRPRRMSIYEMTKSPPPETSIEHYLNERRRSSTVSATFVQQQLEQQSTFEQNYCQRQQYFKDLNEKLINQDRKLLNVVANRGQLHRHSVDIAQLPLEMAQAKGKQQQKEKAAEEVLAEEDEEQQEDDYNKQQQRELSSSTSSSSAIVGSQLKAQQNNSRHQQRNKSQTLDRAPSEVRGLEPSASQQKLQLASISEDYNNDHHRHSVSGRDSIGGRPVYSKTRQKTIIRKFQKLDPSALTATPAPDVKIGQRVAYKEYYGNEFGTIRWIGRVPQISPDWTAGVEFDNAIGEGDGSLNGRRYFIAKDCFAKFLPLDSVAFVDQHVGRPEPGTMISVMSASVRPGQMISIQRVSTVHVQHCFLNAPHRRPGEDILAVNTRLHCQCPNCGPCAHVVKPPRTQRLRTGKNATHMCQFSTYTCCGMESSDEALCTYTGNKISSLPPPDYRSSVGLPPVGNSWIDGSGYLSQLQAQQSKLMPEEYRLGAGPKDYINSNKSVTSRRGSGKQHQQQEQLATQPNILASSTSTTNNPIQDHSNKPSDGRHHHHHHHRHHHHLRHKHQNDDDEHQKEPKSESPIYSNIQNGTENLAQTNSNQLDACCQNYDCNNPVGSSFPPSVSEGNLKSDRTPVQNGTHSSGVAMMNYGNDLGYVDTNKTDIAHHSSPFDMDPPDATKASSAMNVRDMNQEEATEKMPLSTNMNNRNEDDAQFRTPDFADDRPKAAKVLYRDSIDNRYLFPTDDPIDSTLEADLENLSQARYGHCSNVRLNGSRNILRSLRSLVSCLSAKSNQSEAFERRSENTLRFFGQPSTNESNNKSQPTIVMRDDDDMIRDDRRFSSCSSGCNFGVCQEHNSYSKSALSNSSSTLRSNNSNNNDNNSHGSCKISKKANKRPRPYEIPRLVKHHHHHHHHHHHPYTTASANHSRIRQTSRAPPYQENNNGSHNNSSANSRMADKYYTAPPPPQPPPPPQDSHDFKSPGSLSNLIQQQDNFKDERFRSIGGSSSDGGCSLWGGPFTSVSYELPAAAAMGPANLGACGADSSRCSGPRDSNTTANTTNTTTTTKTTTTTMEQVKRQFSSSSDCGFSSASQNSINFHSYPSCSPIMAPLPTLEDEQRRINQIYKRIVAKLISSTTANITNEDLFKLKKTLFEIHSNGCCLHQTSLETNECDQIIADIIRKSYLNLDSTTSGSVSGGCSCLNNMQTSCHEQFHRMSASPAASIANFCRCTTQQQSKVWPNGYYHESDHHHHCHQQQQQLQHEAGRRASSLLNMDSPEPDGAPDCGGRMQKTTTGGGPSRDATSPSTQPQQLNSTSNLGQHQDNRLAMGSRDSLLSGTSQFVQNHATTSPEQTTNSSGAASLPRAFELKLTLSINSDDKNNKTIGLAPTLNEIKAVATCGDELDLKPEVTREIDQDGGSSFNINIKSKGNELEGDGVATSSTSAMGDHDKCKELPNEGDYNEKATCKPDST